MSMIPDETADLSEDSVAVVVEQKETVEIEQPLPDLTEAVVEPTPVTETAQSEDYGDVQDSGLPTYIALRRPAQNVVAKSDKMHTANKLNYEPIAFATSTYKVFNKIMDELIGLNIQITSEDAKRWTSACSEAAATSVEADGLYEAAHRKDATWGHDVEYGGQKITPMMRKPGKLTGGSVGGPAAVSRVSALTRGGSIIRFPLWASGLTVELQNSSLARDIELDARIALDRAFLGRKTRGRIFTMDTYAVARKLVGFIYDNLIDSSMGSLTMDQFLEVVKLPNLQTLALVQAHVNYPKGYPYIRPCTAEPSKCTHTVEETINVVKLSWIDGSQLDNSSKAHMSKQFRGHTMENVKEYQENLYSKKSVVVVNDAITVKLMVPSIGQYLNQSERWVNDLTQGAISAFGDTIDEQQRTEYMQLQYETNLLRNFAMWVESVVIVEEDADGNDITSTITDRDSLDTILMDWSSDEVILEKMLSGIEKYQNDSLIELAAIPNFECPRCGAFQETEDGPFSSLIPIDAVSTFFQMQQSYLITKTGHKNT